MDRCVCSNVLCEIVLYSRMVLCYQNRIYVRIEMNNTQPHVHYARTTQAADTAAADVVVVAAVHLSFPQHKHKKMQSNTILFNWRQR